MQLLLNNPIVPTPISILPSINQIQILEATYSFTNGTIDLVWNELDGYGNLLNSRNETLTIDQTTIFFATPVGNSPDLKTVFIASFLTAIELFYGPATIVSS